MPTFPIKQCQSQLLPVLTSIVNLSLATKTMPSEYKRAIILPLLKKPSLKREVKNYRPVYNLPNVSILIEKAKYVHWLPKICSIMSWTNRFNQLSERFTAPRQNWYFFDNVLNHMDDGHAVFLTLLDLSAAFDSVDHRILLRQRRETVKIDVAALRWFESDLD